MTKIKVSAVMYYNTLPLVYGLKNSDILSLTDLSLDIPATCAHKLLAGTVDVGMVPIAIIPQLMESHIFSKFCIGASSKVRTVVLLSQVPLNKIKKIYLDSHSRTSVALLKILAKEYWKQDFQYLEGCNGFENTEIQSDTAALVIGDKVFNVENKYPYIYDLAQEWINFTGLPFVFAAWVANTKLPSAYIYLFEKAMRYGIENVDKAVDQVSAHCPIGQHGLIDYLQNNIDYELDEMKMKGMDLFLSKLQRY